MAILVGLNHLTRYTYDRPVALGPQSIRLRPAPHTRTKIASYSIKVEPKNHFVNWQQDPHGNWLARYVFPDPVEEFRIEVDLTAELAVINPFDFFVEPYAEEWPFKYADDLKIELAAYLEPEPMGPELEKYLADIKGRKDRTIDFLVHLNAELQKAIRYVIRMEPGVQDPEETLKSRAGSCRDSAWLLVQILRRIGLAARFVSGYLIQLRADVDPIEGPMGTDKDFTDLHAWAEVYIPGAGWVGMDATSGLFTRRRPHSAVRDPALPLRRADNRHGRTGAGRVRVPHGGAAAARGAARHRAVHRRGLDRGSTRSARRSTPTSIAQDVRLTMGGEPTFVSIDHYDAPEWNTGAVGGTKEPIAEELAGRLRERFAKGGFIHFGQGKWYPGESLPRWAYSLYWRKDGEPIWTSPELIALRATTKNPPIEDAELMIGDICTKIGLSQAYILPAYEDTVYWLAREQQLPVNVDPHRQQGRGARGARAHRPHVRARPRQADRLRAAGSALAGGGDQLAQRALAAAARPAVSRARRFPAGAAAADEDAAACAGLGLPLHPDAGPDRGSKPAAAICRAETLLAAGVRAAVRVRPGGAHGVDHRAA